jgi:hypothetical protein
VVAAPWVLEQAERIIAAAQSSEQATRGDSISVTLFVAHALTILAAISRNVTAILSAYGNLLSAWANVGNGAEALFRWMQLVIPNLVSVLGQAGRGRTSHIDVTPRRRR